MNGQAASNALPREGSEAAPTMAKTPGLHRGSGHDDPPDLHDVDLAEDIELLSEVIDRVADHPLHLTREEIDEVLGLDTRQPRISDRSET